MITSHVLATCAPNIRKMDKPPCGITLRKVLDRRIRNLLLCATENKLKYLVLGACGCGRCGNDPREVVGIFHQILHVERFRKEFNHILFAIPVNQQSSYVHKVFKETIPEV
jgi:uncharacterized protein (TIGR02452 family)